MVVITGTNFTHVSGVSFGGQAAGLFYVASPTSIVALSPVAAAGSVSVNVTTSAGTSANSNANAYSVTAPGSGSGSMPPPQNQSYVVNLTAFGGPGSQVSQAFGANAGLGTAGLMSSFTPPLAPAVPVLHPVMSSSMNYAAGTYTWSMTDGGTTVVSSPMNSNMGNGASLTGSWSDTVTFTLSEGGSSSSSSSSSYTHIVRTDTIVNFSEFTAADGTGYTRTDTTVNQVTYDYISSNGSSTYTVDTTGSD